MYVYLYILLIVTYHIFLKERLRRMSAPSQSRLNVLNLNGKRKATYIYHM